MAFCKIVQRLAYDLLSHKLYCTILFGIFCFTILGVFHFFEVYLLWSTRDDFSPKESMYSYEHIDVVYTWVNGSDHSFIENMKKYSNNKHNLDLARYDDKSELKYSLRSLDKHAPWVRNVYIVTNGQLPSWINIQHDRLKIVPHDKIAPPEILPTFSSPAIETFIHKIPDLSRYFLYLNDDIFFGAVVFPDDFRTHSRGIRLFTAWNTPACAHECPWSYVGDGSCDPQCNFPDCQYDGGDCIKTHIDTSVEHSTQYNYRHIKDSNADMQHAEIDTRNKLNYPKLGFKKENIQQPNLLIQSLGTSNESQNLTKDEYETVKNINLFDGKKITNNSSVKIVNKKLQLENLRNMSRAVEIFNENYLKTKKIKNKQTGLANDKTDNNKDVNNSIASKIQYNDDLDFYAKSLIYTNKIFNLRYGFKSRKVPAHVPFLIDKLIIEELQKTFKKEIDLTANNKFRSANDFQFAFSYYYYIMSETKNLTVQEIYNQIDTDRSGTWSDRELRTLLAKLNPLPLDWSAVEGISFILKKCGEGVESQASTPPNERYLDSEIPTITKKLVEKCPLLIEILLENFSITKKFKFELIKQSGQYAAFQMLTSNISQVVTALDEIRKSPKKFVCINDNLDPVRTEDNELSRALLEDFYMSLFPLPSQYELPNNYRNRFAYINDLDDFNKQMLLYKLLIYLCICLVAPFSLYKLCSRHNVKRRKYLIV